MRSFGKENDEQADDRSSLWSEAEHRTSISGDSRSTITVVMERSGIMTVIVCELGTVFSIFQF